MVTGYSTEIPTTTAVHLIPAGTNCEGCDWITRPREWELMLSKEFITV